jgi:predicted ATPase
MAETLTTLSTEYGFTQWAAHGMFSQGWALAMLGRGEGSIVQMHQSLTDIHATGQEVVRLQLLYLLAEASGKLGQTNEGLSLLTEALAVTEGSGQRFYEAETYRLKGELLLWQATPDRARAETCFQQALTVARRQKAKSLELRVAMSLSRLWQRQDKRAEARQLLAPIYGGFTEGFDTADLQEANTLLEELG